MRLHLPIRLLNAVLSSFRRMGRTVGTATVIAASMISGAFADDPESISVTWDSAWNLETTPTTGYNITLSETTTSLYDADKKQDGIGYVYVVNSESELTNAIVAGGFYDTGESTNGTTIDGNIWLDVQSGTYKLIIGGSTANNWSGTRPAFSINGDVMTQLEGSTSVALVVGGLYCDAQSPTLTGNVYTSVQDKAVITGTLVGGTIVAHNKSNTIAGSTYVSISNIQSVTNDTNWDPENSNNSILTGYIIAGSAFKWNGGTANITGGTNLTVDTGKSTSLAEM
jgi:hypothetical protein